MKPNTYFSKNKIKEIKTENIKPDIFLNIKNIPLEKIEEKAMFIKKFGIIFPLSVRPNIKYKDKFYLISDPLTYLAVLFLNIKTVPCMILRITRTEGALCFFNSENLNIIERAEIIKFLIRPGNYTIREISEILNISPSFIDTMLLPLVLNGEEKNFIINKSFGYKFLKEFVKSDEKKRKEIMNNIIANDFYENEAVSYIKNLLNPKTEPKKTATIKNGELILNSLEKICENLEIMGIAAETKEEKTEKGYEYKIVLSNNNSVNKLI